MKQNKLITYRKIGRRDGGERGKNQYRVTIAGVSTTYTNSREAKRAFRSALKHQERSLS